MTKGHAAVVGTVTIGLLGTLAACSAVLGITDFTAEPVGNESGSSSSGGPDASSGSSSGSSSGAVTDGEAGPSNSVDCATEDGAAGAVGCRCDQSKTPLGCNGYAQPQHLSCGSDGLWAMSTAFCGPLQNCDTRPGQSANCATIVADCTGALPDQKVCIGQNVIQCGPDLVSESNVTTCMNQACVDGGCTGSCTPSATQCSSNSAQTCDTNGLWDASTACTELCVTSPVGDAGVTDAGDAGPTASACGHFPSCQPGASGGPAGADNSCGDNLDVDGGDDGGEAGAPAGNLDCCTSPVVPGTATGSLFYRSYDGITTGNKSMNAPATFMSAFRLDQYEATVGRFRQFVDAVDNGWTPTPGSGKHSYLNGGAGLAAAIGADAGANEPGFPSGQSLPTNHSTWTSNLGCFQNTWTDSPSTSENLPINCITWYEAYAFCIWDGGFLPSEAEWNYAAAGGTAQRVYPWANTSGPLNDAGTMTPAPNNIDCTFANYSPSGSTACAGSPTPVGSYSTQGDGRYGQADLAGNVSEWTLDSTASTPSPYAGNMGGSGTCADCAQVSTSSAFPNRIARGGSFNIVALALYASYRLSYPPTNRDGTVGVRCARAP